MRELVGYVDHIIYRNEENGYCVFVLIPKEPIEEEGLENPSKVTCIGVFPSLGEGESLKVEGEFRVHGSFGLQFSAARYEQLPPDSEEAVRRYLGSGAIKGIGPVLAGRIVDFFGEDTLRVMDKDPMRLAEIKGVSRTRAREIGKQIREQFGQRHIFVELAGYGISLNMSVRIFKQYGMETLQVLKENPYRLADEVRGVGFQKADEIAMRIGMAQDSEFRIKSGLIFLLQEASGNGNMYLPVDEFLMAGIRLLELPEELLKANFENLVMEGKLKVVHGEEVYLTNLYRMEDRIAGLLLSLDENFEKPKGILEASIHKIEVEEGMELDTFQKKAVMEAASHGVFVLTGGPGTGKTTTIRAIIRYFEKEGLEVSLAAPTGRAAKRMGEACGQEAKTIHRLLEVNGGGQSEDGSYNGRFDRNEDNPLETDIIIVDEMSMVDAQIMHALMRAISAGTRLILVGDVNQLPSVGPGNVLRDIIASGAFAVVKLQKIFRQAKTSDIVMNAHRINEGDKVVLDNKSKDFFFMKRPDADHIISVTKQLVQTNLPKYVHAPSYDIQVLTPTRRGQLGVERLNKILQMFLNPESEKKAEHTFGNRTFREGDKVMQIRNNYQTEWEVRGRNGVVVNSGSGIFNGDLGVVRSINEYNSVMTIEFDEGRFVDYPFSQVEELEHAFAVTIHKSQGSEYPAVVIPLLPGPPLLYTRNLLYTAITRAKKCVVLVGEEKVFYGMIENNMEQRRLSGLKDRIQERARSIMD